MKRKDFLKTLALGGAAVATGSFDALESLAQSTKKEGTPDLVAVAGGEPDVMFQKAIAALGGMEKYVKKGDKVVVKPNIGWDKTPELAANTNPILVAEIVKQSLAAGASEVIVFDQTCDKPWTGPYKNSGIEDAARAAGAKILPGDLEEYYREVALPNGVKLKSTKIHQAILDSDVWFNVPILKTHGGAKMTISLKNYMGIVFDRRIFHSTDLQQCIADACTFEKKPALNIIDAYRTMKSNGPRGKSEADAVLTKALFISPDIVAADTAAVKFFNSAVAPMNLDDVTHIAKAAELKVGTMDLEKLNIDRIKV